MSDTKAAFLAAYPRPLPGLYDVIIQELLVQQHLLRFQKKYTYDPVRAPRRRRAFQGLGSPLGCGARWLGGPGLRMTLCCMARGALRWLVSAPGDVARVLKGGVHSHLLSWKCRGQPIDGCESAAYARGYMP